MLYIIGTEKDREAFESTNNIPYFEFEEQLDANTVCLHNNEDEAATLYIDLNTGIFTVAAIDQETGGVESETEYTDYAEAVEAYEIAEGE